MNEKSAKNLNKRRAFSLKEELCYAWNEILANLKLDGNLKLHGLEYSLEGLMLKLKLQYFGLLMRRTDSLEKTLILGKIEGGRRRG